MLHKMSLGYFVLIIYDLNCKCLEYVFVKIVEVLVSDVQACGVLLEMQEHLCLFGFLDWNAALSSWCIAEFQSTLKIALQCELRMGIFNSYVNQGANGLPVVTHHCVEGLWGICIGEASRLEGKCQVGTSCHRMLTVVPKREDQGFWWLFLASKSEVCSVCLGWSFPDP